MSKENIVLVSEMSAPEDFEIIWERDVLRSLDPTNKYKATERLYKYKGEQND